MQVSASFYPAKECVSISNMEEFYKKEVKVQDGTESLQIDGTLDMYSASPELQRVGSKEEYDEYISLLFPNSKVDDICYRGTAGSSEFIDNPGTNDMHLRAVFFTHNKDVAKFFAEDNAKIHQGTESIVHAAKINIISPFLSTHKLNLRKEVVLDSVLRNILQKPSDLDMFWKGYEYFLTFWSLGLTGGLEAFNLMFNTEYSQELFQLFLEVEKAEGDFDISSYLQTYYDGLIIPPSTDGLGIRQYDQVAVFSKEQIHVLGTEKDVEGFSVYLKNNKK